MLLSERFETSGVPAGSGPEPEAGKSAATARRTRRFLLWLGAAVAAVAVLAGGVWLSQRAGAGSSRGTEAGEERIAVLGFPGLGTVVPGPPVLPSLLMSITERPPFIISSETVEERQGQYPNSDERLCFTRRIGRSAGLLRIGINQVRLPPGHRTSWPHAEEDEEEFVYVLEGNVDAWVDGVLYPMKAGDFAAFPAGTGICHTFINNGEREARLLAGGEADKSDSRIFYPLHPQRRGDMPWSRWWDDAPPRPRGPHDGKPDALRLHEPKA